MKATTTLMMGFNNNENVRLFRLSHCCLPDERSSRHSDNRGGLHFIRR